MRAIGYREPQPISSETSLIDLDLPVPVATGRDLLVEVKAVSVNPVDTKVRRNARPAEGEVRVLGWDAAGVVKAVGPEVKAFKPGDAVFYAGAIDRPGSNAEFQLIDERIVGAKPASLSFAEAAALPLTAITAWEALFDRIRIADAVPGAAKALLIVGGAGGVGSIAIQLARQLTDLTVIATASRPETQAWARELGAHHVIDHGKPLAAEVEALRIGAPGLVFVTTHTLDHLPEIIKLIAPQGRIAVIDDAPALDVMPLKGKSLSLHWEMMFARSLHQTADMQAQGDLLSEVSRLVDAGKIRTTLSETFGTINAGNLKRAHALIETNRAKGKIVLEGF
ncbi:zinc-binding alcohol dehydrogenase family protein [Bosea psychrotolerans]|uniref:Zinc-type alcohol dehydrogenase-like protein n=1 Tax=Bosea psychrotolerans TaxID=1871628 RepID=A0A2S4M4A3_9HYPH|nr:zinc-binding alcohol dehydrogenase family protein [Bosea psychrotolerans]POR49532.1 zinc-binding alcohol dehydrogenase family protein [Bosea psychrotolerans]